MKKPDGSRKHTPEFRVQIVERMLAGENVMALAHQYGLARSMMYRWRDAYRERGIVGLACQAGSKTAPPKSSSNQESKTETKLRQKIAELERKVGQQEVEIDFFKEVFKRLEELPEAPRRGGNASTQRS